MLNMGLMLSLIASLCGTSVPVEQQEIHVRTMEIVQLDYNADVVYCIDSVGFEWAFCGCEDYAEGDLVTAIMSNNGTPQTILDDVILDTEYSGYYPMQAEDLTSDNLRICGH